MGKPAFWLGSKRVVFATDHHSGCMLSRLAIKQNARAYHIAVLHQSLLIVHLLSAPEPAWSEGVAGLGQWTPKGPLIGSPRRASEAIATVRGSNGAITTSTSQRQRKHRQSSKPSVHVYSRSNCAAALLLPPILSSASSHYRAKSRDLHLPRHCELPVDTTAATNTVERATILVQRSQSIRRTACVISRPYRLDSARDQHRGIRGRLRFGPHHSLATSQQHTRQG